MKCPYHYHATGAPDEHFWCLYFWQSPECEHCDLDKPPTLTLGYEPSTVLDWVDQICLGCLLPRCVPDSEACPYLQATNQLTREQRAYSEGKTCPHPACGKPIMNRSRTCRTHQWYRDIE